MHEQLKRNAASHEYFIAKNLLFSDSLAYVKIKHAKVIIIIIIIIIIIDNVVQG